MLIQSFRSVSIQSVNLLTRYLVSGYSVSKLDQSLCSRLIGEFGFQAVNPISGYSVSKYGKWLLGPYFRSAAIQSVNSVSLFSVGKFAQSLICQ